MIQTFHSHIQVHKPISKSIKIISGRKMLLTSVTNTKRSVNRIKGSQLVANTISYFTKAYSIKHQLSLTSKASSFSSSLLLNILKKKEEKDQNKEKVAPDTFTRYVSEA
jgi:hypothetical protein